MKSTRPVKLTSKKTRKNKKHHFYDDEDMKAIRIIEKMSGVEVELNTNQIMKYNVQLYATIVRETGLMEPIQIWGNFRMPTVEKRNCYCGESSHIQMLWQTISGRITGRLVLCHGNTQLGTCYIDEEPVNRLKGLHKVNRKKRGIIFQIEKL